MKFTQLHPRGLSQCGAPPRGVQSEYVTAGQGHTISDELLSIAKARPGSAPSTNGDQSPKAEARERSKLVRYVESTGYKTAREGLPSPRTTRTMEYSSRRPTYVVGAAPQREQISRNEPAEPECRLGSMTYAFRVVLPSPRPCPVGRKVRASALTKERLT